MFALCNAIKKEKSDECAYWLPGRHRGMCLTVRPEEVERIHEDMNVRLATNTEPF